MGINMYKKNSKRFDLVKYNQPTKNIAFKVSQKYEGKGTAARDLLLGLFVQLLSDIPVSDTEIEQCGYILGYKMKRDDH